jgi:hypothetical protein
MDETKRIVFDNYPVEKLPEDVRNRFVGEDSVVLTVESRGRLPARRTISQILDAMQHHRTLSDDPVERIRALRGEWGHRDELHARIRRGETI